MQIRAHNQTDFDQLAELRWLLKASDDPTVSQTEQHSFKRSFCKQLQLSESLGDSIHWGIDDQPKLAGALTIRVVRKELSPSCETGASGYLTNTFVRKDLRGRGLGSQLLKRAIGWANEEHLELLIVWPSEHSYPFYRRAGFRGESDPLELALQNTST